MQRVLAVEDPEIAAVAMIPVAVLVALPRRRHVGEAGGLRHALGFGIVLARGLVLDRHAQVRLPVVVRGPGDFDPAVVRSSSCRRGVVTVRIFCRALRAPWSMIHQHLVPDGVQLAGECLQVGGFRGSVAAELWSVSAAASSAAKSQAVEDRRSGGAAALGGDAATASRSPRPRCAGRPGALRDRASSPASRWRPSARPRRPATDRRPGRRRNRAPSARASAGRLRLSSTQWAACLLHRRGAALGGGAQGLSWESSASARARSARRFAFSRRVKLLHVAPAEARSDEAGGQGGGPPVVGGDGMNRAGSAAGRG